MSEAWGEWGSADEHERYAERIATRVRCRQERCGKRTTHVGKANGVALMNGCEWHVYRWVHSRGDGQTNG